MGEILSPKVILITGSSSGFGYLTAIRLAEAGHIVYATMRDPAKGEALLEEADRRGCAKRLHVWQLDVTKPETIKAAVRSIVAADGVIDVLVNNAGFGIGGFFEDLSPEDFQQQFDVNFFGVLNVTREVLPVMRPRRKGKIINVSSMAAYAGTPCFSAYCSSKWALEGFSECLYMELQPFGIDVALVEPGSYRTKIFEENARVARRFDNHESPYYGLSQRFRKDVLRHIRHNDRDPDEVARVIERIIVQSGPAFRHVVGWRQKFRAFCLRVRLCPFKLYAELVNMALTSPSE
ncbi:MAG: SDR family oxidoreductase [Candidatus Omnitrophica bacterium]|nr:SDR family oxidoreductase [Candidatus Omnitrophota bacterium]